MNALTDPTFLPLLLKSLGFLALAFLLWPLAKRQSAAFQAIYWRSAMVGLLVLTVFSLWLPILSIKLPNTNSTTATPVAEASPSSAWRSISTTSSTTIASLGTAPVSPSPEIESAAPRSSVANPLLTAWCVGSAVIASLWLLTQLRLARVRSIPTPDSRWDSLLDECQDQLGMRRQVRLAFSEKMAMPCAWGIVRPTVMLPKAAEDWSEERQRMVLMHELAHLKRHDPLHDLIGRIAVTLFWLNPLAWLAFKQLRIAAERATDDAVVDGGCAAQPYAALLLQFAKEGLAGRRLGLTTVAPMAQRSTVGVRVEKLLDGSQKRGAPKPWRVAAMLATLSLMAALVGGAQRAQAQDPVEDKPDVATDKQVPSAPAVTEREVALTGVEHIRNKLRSIIIPEVDFTEATIEEAVDYLRRQSIELDKTGNKKGINIIIRQQIGGAKEKEVGINLQLSNVPLESALKFTTQLAGYRYKIDPLAVVVMPPYVESGQLITQTFRVPADFQRNRTDPKGDRPDAIAILKSVGVEFPEGASAAYIPAKSELVVRNTGTNMELIQVYITDLYLLANLPMVNMRAEIYSLPKLQALQLIERFDKEVGSETGVAAVAELRKLVAAKKAKLVGAPSITSMSGETAAIASGISQPYISGYVGVVGFNGKASKDEAVITPFIHGTTIEFEGVVDADGFTISVVTKVEKTFGEPVFIDATVPGPASGKPLPIQTVRVDRASISTTTKLYSGQTRLIGTLSPSDSESDTTEIVLMKVWLKKM